MRLNQRDTSQTINYRTNPVVLLCYGTLEGIPLVCQAANLNVLFLKRAVQGAADMFYLRD